MLLRSVNLNLLPVLRELLRTRNLSHAAQALHLTQPAVSAALGKLRIALDDPLLVRLGRTMVLTPRARELLPLVERACEAVHAVWDRAPFDPGQSRRHFVVTSIDYGSLLLGPALARDFKTDAPGVSLQFVQFSRASLDRRHVDDVDFFLLPREALEAIGSHDLQLMPLFKDELVAVVGTSHPLAKRRQITEDTWLQQRYVVFQPWLAPLEGAYADFVGAVSTAANGTGRIGAVLSVDQFSVMPMLAAMSDSVALVPRRMVAQLMTFLDLKIVGAPLPLLQPEVCLAWSPVHDADPGHRWFRSRVAAVFAAAGDVVTPLQQARTLRK